MAAGDGDKDIYHGQGDGGTMLNDTTPQNDPDKDKTAPVNGDVTTKGDDDVGSSKGDVTIFDSPSSPPRPPDGGYGWVIVFASFMTNVIVDGVCFSVGIFMIEFLEYFESNKATMSWVGSVLNGMYLSVGKCLMKLEILAGDLFWLIWIILIFV